MRQRFRLPLLVFLCALLPSGLIMAQSTGGLRVQVLDSGGPLPGATVTIRNDDRRIAEHSAISDQDGRVDLPVLPAGGAYQIEVSFPGYATVIVRDLRVRTGEHPTVPVRLAEEYTETVTIVGERPVVDLEKSSSSAKFSDDFIGDLPVKGRFYQNVLTLAPGVQDANEDGDPNVHGSRARDFRAVVGGVANVDPLTGKYRANVNPNAIEEIEVITSGAGPEYGRAQGGFANIVLKQGSNRFEGVFGMIYRSDKFDGDGAGNIASVEVPKFEWVQPSLQVSGPIVKDRLWYRLSHEWISRDDPLNIGNSLIVLTTEQRINSDQITWQVSDRNKLALRYDSNPISITNYGVDSLTPAASAEVRDFEADTWALVWSASVSPQLFVESVAAWQDGGLEIRPTSPGSSNNCVRGIGPIEMAQCQDFYSGLISGPYWRDFSDDRQRFTLRSDATFYPRGKFLGMDHQLKLGFIVENERYEREIVGRPRIDFYSRQPSIAESLAGITEPAGTVLADIPVPELQRATAVGASAGLYLKDQMRPRENVVLEIGARIDHEIVNSEGRARFDPEAEFQEYNRLLGQGWSTNDALSETFTAFEGIGDIVSVLSETLGVRPQRILFLFGPLTVRSSFQTRVRRPDDIDLRNTNVSPFIATSWDPWSNGKTKFAFTAGRYYNNIPLIIPTWELAPVSVRFALQSERIGREWVLNELDPGREKIDPSANLYVVDRDLRTPYQDEFTLTVERELLRETSVGVTYIRRKYRDQFQDVDINHRSGDLGTCVPVLKPGDPSVVAGSDGIIDDCSGAQIFSGIINPQTGLPIYYDAPDGIPDLYTLNPFWGTISRIGNYNEADYEAVQLEVLRRQFRGWELQGSYVWSVAEGNGEDFDQLLGNDQALVEDEVGFQSTDQRHVVKFAGTTVTPWGFRLGGTVIWQSGLPYSILRQALSIDTVPPSLDLNAGFEPRTRLTYPTGQRNDQRNVSYWDLGLKATKEFLVGRANVQLSVEVFNLLNDGTYLIYNQFDETGFQLNGRNEAYRRFGRRFQLGARVAF